MRMRLLLLLLWLLPALADADERLGRLFLTPGERNSLDYLRQTSKPPEKIVVGEEPEKDAGDQPPPPPPAAPAPVSVQGYVKRSDGKGTVWVNRQPVRETSRQGEIEIGKLGGPDNRVRVKVPGTGQPIELKAGQTYDPASGKVVDNARELPQPEPAAAPIPSQPQAENKGAVEAPATAPAPIDQSATTPPAPGVRKP